MSISHIFELKKFKTKKHFLSQRERNVINIMKILYIIFNNMQNCIIIMYQM